MGPSPFGDGEPPPAGPVAVRSPASMGPSPFGDGELDRRAAGRGFTPGFNGALALRRRRALCVSPFVDQNLWLLQWGRRPSATERTTNDRGSRRRRSFNGAVALRRR